MIGHGFGINMMFLAPFFIGIALATLILWIWAIVDCISSDKGTDEKLLWIILILFTNIIGAIIYLIIGKDRNLKDGSSDRKISSNKNSKKSSKKVLEKDSDNAMIEGVCAGIAKHLDIDVTLVRLLAVLLIFMSHGSVILFYIIAAIIMPESGKKNVKSKRAKKSGLFWVLVILSILLIIGMIISMAVAFFGYSSFVMETSDYDVERVRDDVIVNITMTDEYAGEMIISKSLGFLRVTDGNLLPH